MSSDEERYEEALPTLSVAARLFQSLKSDEQAHMYEFFAKQDEPTATDDDDDDEDIDQETALRVVGYAAAYASNTTARELLFEQLSERAKMEYIQSESYKEFRCPLLFWAVKDGLNTVVRSLLDKRYNISVNQVEFKGETLLQHSVKCAQVAMSRFLLQNGADPNQWKYWCDCPLFVAVEKENIHLVRALLEYGAHVHFSPRSEIPTAVDAPLLAEEAIGRGMTKILPLLLSYGAPVRSTAGVAVLNDRLFEDNEGTAQTSKTKRSICRTLAKHAKSNEDTAIFLQASIDEAIDFGDLEHSDILLDAGVRPSQRAMCGAICSFVYDPPHCLSLLRMLLRYGIDPFLVPTTAENDGKDDSSQERPISLLQASARDEEIEILEFLLDRWDERFSSNGGKNSNGDFPIHALCCDPKVSIEAIKFVAERYKTTMATVDDEKGLFPVHFAAMWDADLEVIFFLLKHYPDALSQVRRPIPTTITPSSTITDAASRKRQLPNQLEKVGRPKKKVAT